MTASKRTLVAAAVALASIVAAVVIFLMFRDDEQPPAAAFVSPIPTFIVTPTVTALPELPDGCLLIASHRIGDRTLRVAEEAPVVIEAQSCAAKAWSEVPVIDLTATLVWRLDREDGPREMLVELPAERADGVLSWSGSTTYPEAGVWAAALELGGLTTQLGASDVLSGLGLVPGPQGAPVPAVPQQVTVLHIDRPDEEPTHWDAAQSGGMAWIPGQVPGEPARAVWVQPRDGADWVVAGDPTNGVVTGLFQVESPALLIGAPDGRGFVTVDRLLTGPRRVRVYSAERESLVEIPVAENTHPTVSWAPDSSVVILAEQRLHLLRSDGTQILVSDEPASSAVVDWAPDSKWALVTAASTGDTRLLKVDVNTSSVTRLFEYGGGMVQQGWGNIALSPDAASIALGWLDSAARALRVAVLPSDQPFPADLDARAAVSYPLPPEQSGFEWLSSMEWSPDSTQLAFSLGATEPIEPGVPFVSTLQILDIGAGTARELARPIEGFYSGGPLWWSTDGATVFKTWFSCVACDGGDSGVDVIDVESGTIVRTIAHGGWLGTLDGVRHLVSTPGELLTVRGQEEPRPLMSRGAGLEGGYSAQPSPDANRLAVIQSVGLTQSVFAVTPDGEAQTALGSLDRNYHIEGLRDAGTALTLEAGGAWSWASLADGATQPLPGLAMAAAADQAAAAFSSDGTAAAYWAGTATPGTLQLFVVDLASDDARPLEVFTEQGKGMHLEMSPRGDRVAYLEPGQLVTADLADGRMQRFALAHMGYEPLRTVHSLPFEWAEEGAAIHILVGGTLWRADLASGLMSEVTPAAPAPGGWTGEVELSRSPDGAHLVALTVFGLFHLEADGSWRQVTGAGLERAGVFPARLVWSDDARRVAYVSGGGVGLVVADVEGAAYELVSPDPSGRLMRVLDWLPDGRIVYMAVAQGI